MSNGLKILGYTANSEDGGGENNQPIYWELEELENAFYFSVPAYSIEPLFIEHDELTAAGPAYKQRGPLHMLDLIVMLESLAPGFVGIKISLNMTLTRQRLSRSPGLSFEVSGKTTNFMKDETLKTLNFLDFYRDIIQPKL